MKILCFLPALVLTALPARAAFVTLSSPDGLWSWSPDEFGAYGEGTGGSFAQRNFGSGLTGYSWQAATLVTDGVNRQWLSGGASAGSAGYTGTPLGAGNLISDTSTSSTRTSVYTAGTLSTLRVTLTQSATNAGLSQQYVFNNTGGAALNFSVISFHDTDLDANTFLNDLITSRTGYLQVSEGGRNLYFSSAGVGYQGFLAAHVPGSGVTGGANVLAENNNGIPFAVLNQFRDVTNGGIGADFDANVDGITDTPTDVGYLLQYNLSIPAGGSSTVTFLTSAVPVPEPGSAIFLGLTGLLAFRRRR